jgi:hypothetical protein
LGQLESQPKEQGDECLDAHDGGERRQPSRLFQESKTKSAMAADIRDIQDWRIWKAC